MVKELDKSSYDFRRLKCLYPNNTKFYVSYFEGSYLDRATTTYYDENKKEVEIKVHDYYG